jgi:hypothetical protein
MILELEATAKRSKIIGANCRLILKGFKDSAWGFYEAELVKAALQKSIFLKFCPFGPRSGDKTPTTGSLVFDRHGARHEHRDDQAPKVSEAFSASATGLG